MNDCTKTMLPFAAALALLLSPAGAAVAGAESAAAGVETAAMSPDTGAAANASETEMRILKELHHTNQQEIRLGNLAEKKIKMRTEATWGPETEKVRDYAQMLVQDHQNLDEKVRKLASNEGVSLQKLGKNEKQKLEKHAERLDNLSGNEFDSAFLKAMLNGHEKAIQRFEKAEGNVQSADVKGLLRDDVLPVLKKHHDRAQKLRARFGGEGGLGLGAETVP